MKRLNHLFKFGGRSDWRDFVPCNAICKYCGLLGQDCFDKLPNNIRNSFYGIFSEKRLKTELKAYNEYFPCLTEEEYIIKTIIE